MSAIGLAARATGVREAHPKRHERETEGAQLDHDCERLAITLAINSPWKRPFSMNTVPVRFPATCPPATNNPGTLVS